ncbi:MAG: hypothetical protein WCI05_19475, partial [Myxococcales bacterium]
MGKENVEGEGGGGVRSADRTCGSQDGFGLVLDEVAAGDPSVAAQRLEALCDVPLLELIAEATALGRDLLRQAAIPRSDHLNKAQNTHSRGGPRCSHAAT